MMELNIAFSSDNNYATHLGVAILSLLENNKNFEQIYIHILDNGISLENKNKLREIAYSKADIFFYELSNLLLTLEIKYNIPNTISISAYARLFLSEILDKGITKIIYADCDAIFMNSLDKLWSLDLSNFSLAGVLDHVGVENKLKIGLKEDSPYINSGFLLINLDKWRNTNVQYKMLSFIGMQEGDVIHHDQGVINACFKNDIMLLKPNYNVMTSFFDFKSVNAIKEFYGVINYYSQEQIVEAKRNPIFLHFTPSFSKRPWVKGSVHPLKKKYLEYLSKTPFKNNMLQKDNRDFKIKLLEKIYWIFGARIYKILFK